MVVLKTENSSYTSLFREGSGPPLQSSCLENPIDGETVETVSDFTFLGSKITADGDFSHEIKIHLLLGRNVMANLDSIFREGNDNRLQYSCLENHMDGGAW